MKINIVIKDENKNRIEEVLGGVQKRCRENGNVIDPFSYV